MDDPETPLVILVVDDEPNIRKTVTFALEAERHRVTAVSNARDARTEAGKRLFDMALVDLRLGADSGMELISALQVSCPWIKIVVMTAHATIDSAVEAMRRGAFDYIPKPFTLDQLVVLTNKAAHVRNLERKVDALREALHDAAPEADFTSRSPAMEKVLAMAHQVAASNATILVRGESGTGKTMIAGAIHAWSRRAGKAFGVLSAPSLSPELFESELFGHVRGAFTGALRDNPGRIAMCEGGTLLLDEVGDLPSSVQAKLLRFLQERAYERVGDLETRKADVRLLAATNVDLETAVKAGAFREDLFYRLNVVEIVIPPLRERPEDILPLAERLLAFFARQNHRRFPGFTSDAEEAIKTYAWPGNIRELRNAIERAVLLSNESTIGVEHLPVKITPAAPPIPAIGDLVSLDTIEEMHIRQVLAATKSLDEASKILGVDTVTLWRRRKKYGI
jgi:NtrC-family two-component system response regulator AlgB